MISVNKKWQNFLNEEVKKIYVHGYIKPESSFHTLSEWEIFVNQILKKIKETPQDENKQV